MGRFVKDPKIPTSISLSQAERTTATRAKRWGNHKTVSEVFSEALRLYVEDLKRRKLAEVK